MPVTIDTRRFVNYDVRIADALERIADALEAAADALDTFSSVASVEGELIGSGSCTLGPGPTGEDLPPAPVHDTAEELLASREAGRAHP